MMPPRDERGRFTKPLPQRPREWLEPEEESPSLLQVGAIVVLAGLLLLGLALHMVGAV